MKAQIRYSGEDLPNLAGEAECTTVGELEAFLLEYNLIRDRLDLRSDLDCDTVSYFKARPF